ncbi:MAG: hypothetical protein HYU36_19905 [Planctomycetes bacterium]|nr:hypothetical protein [Planctomycetota bacterium]
MSHYLSFVQDTLQTLIKRQSARLAGAPYGIRCITVTGTVTCRYRSLNARRSQGFSSIVIEERLPEPSPKTMDFGIWPVLDRLSERTGDPKYRQMMVDMVEVFVDYGFDPRSGLPYFGAMSDFDVVRLGPSPYLGVGPPGFKFTADLPLDVLHAKAPDKMNRMLKAFFWAMVTRPETMDFNRFGYYAFEDCRRQHAMPYQPEHVAFASAGAWMIEAWAFHFSKTGDPESLERARAMTNKWGALQHAETGLMPHFLGSKQEGETTMTAQPYVHVGDSVTGIILLTAADRLASRPTAHFLAGQLRGMGLRLLRGLARFAYDPEQRLFHNWLQVVDGRPHTESYIYHFSSQAQKDYWVQRDPSLADVAVHAGSDYYGAAPSSWGCGVSLPFHTARAAEMTRDPFLTERARFFADGAMDAASVLAGPCNASGQWSYPASASYISLMLCLHRLTGEAKYVHRAQELADREIRFLGGLPPETIPQWWQMPFRNKFLEALLDLDAIAHS